MAGNRAGGLTSNLEHFGSHVTVGRGVSDDMEMLLYDPQTSGGLLVAVSPDAVDDCRAAFRAREVTGHEIGTVGMAVGDVHVCAVTSE